ncbi:conserved hypothetical protein [Ricinus communis]|uniref:Uncharacterized protein n=1 Tax=Ricinus communis TaxID=3988 RepID=B9SYN8_RICCO|nr:conserved hypothetical protein [Ricinus communis]
MPSATTAHANHSLRGDLQMSQDQYGDDSKAIGNTGGTSTTGGDSMGDDEDAKSEGYSWKNHIHRS